MAWVKALNGNVLDLPDDLADILVAQGHEVFEVEARKGKPDAEPDAEPEPARAPARKSTTRAK